MILRICFFGVLGINLMARELAIVMILLEWLMAFLVLMVCRLLLVLLFVFLFMGLRDSDIAEPSRMIVLADASRFGQYDENDSLRLVQFSRPHFY